MLDLFLTPSGSGITAYLLPNLFLPTCFRPPAPPNKAQLSAGPSTDASQHSRKAAGSSTSGNDGWEFSELLVTSEALAAEMMSQSMMVESAAGGRQSGGEKDVRYTRSSSMPVPPPPEFRLDAGDIGHHR